MPGRPKVLVGGDRETPDLFEEPLAQLRAENEQRERDFEKGCQILNDVSEAVSYNKRFPTTSND